MIADCPECGRENVHVVTINVTRGAYIQARCTQCQAWFWTLVPEWDE